MTDPRFDPKVYTEYEVTLNKNRKHYIKAYLELPEDAKDEKKAPVASTFLPPRFTDSAWPYHSDVSALSASGKDYSGLSVDFAAPKLISGPTALDTIHVRCPLCASVYSFIPLKSECVGACFFHRRFGRAKRT